MPKAERIYKADTVELMIETGFVTNMTWGQWKNGSLCLETFISTWEGVSFIYNVHDDRVGYLGSGFLSEVPEGPASA